MAREDQQKALHDEESLDKMECLRQCEAVQVEGRDQVRELHRCIEEFEAT